ncbi:MAG: MBL fold metallo-hydrolase [Chloroflexi bacterium]|nr:MBL fold metallo-hydrolase [Chloroflexota bacterium]
MRIREGIHRLGNGTINAYLLADPGGGVTIIDAGLPGYWAALPAELAAMGRSLADVRAIVLTHGHSDHIGFAEQARRERRVPVSVHELDAALARGDVPNPAKGLGPVRLRPLLAFLVYGALRGALRTKRLGEVGTFGDGATLDVPGLPRVVLLPGHTPGSAALHAPSHDALFSGDAIGTVNVVSGVSGPMIPPFSADRESALASLGRLATIEAGWLLPGHGEPWTQGVAAAVARVQERGSAPQ